jgi:hypothetical protein
MRSISQSFKCYTGVPESWLTMVESAVRRACLIFICSPFMFCSAATASERDVTIVPRVKPKTVADHPHADLRVDVPLVLIPVRLFEDGVEQRITHFACEDAPVSIGLLLDASGSMRNKMRKSSEAARELFKTTNFDDEFFLI